VNIVRDHVAFNIENGEYRFVATYLTEPVNQAVIEVFKAGEIVRSFLWPAYKIWNIAAHADDIARGLESGSDEGLKIAGDTGFGGNVYQEQREGGPK